MTFNWKALFDYITTWVVARLGEKSTWGGIVGGILIATNHSALSGDPRVDMVTGTLASLFLILTQEKK
jgi:hypothetical protein